MPEEKKFDPIKLQTADPGEMVCRDCIYRDQTTMKIDGDKVYIGIMRDTCLIYDGKKGNWKPTKVVLRNQYCDFYVQDETAEKFWEGKK